MNLYSTPMLGILLALGALASAQAAETARVSVDATKTLGPVNPLVFGHNVEAADSQFIFGPNSTTVSSRTGDGLWDPVARRPVPQALEAARAIGMKMLRYPGGCLVHNFDWHKAVGPLEERPNYTFGVDEFVQFCRAAGAEPLMTTSAYVGGPQDLADLVEYCNAPADEAHPWAMKRARWGHPQPYAIRHWEMGNESDHGNHDVKPFRKHTPESYADWYLQSARLMRRVDPSIRIGGLMGTGTGPRDPWNRVVLTRAGQEMDFVIVHTYAVGLWKQEPKDVDLALRAAMAAGEQFEAMLGEYHALIRECCGKDLPLAITEYNASYVQEKPAPFRFSAAAALFSADYVRLLLKPETNVLMANYWHFINGYWGMLHGPRLPEEKTPWRQMAAYYFYRLWGQHTGSRLVSARVESPGLEFEGFGRTLAARRDGKAGEVAVALSGGKAQGCQWATAGEGGLRLELAGVRGEHHLPLARIVVPEQRAVRLSFEARLTGELPADTRIGIGMIDARGWEATKSGIGVDGVGQGRDRWVVLDGVLNTLPGCKSADLTWRILAGQTPATAAVEIRNLRVQVLPTAPPYAAVTACATLSDDGRTLSLMLFNKHHAEEVDLSLDVRGFRTSGGRLWQVTAPSLAAMNLAREDVRETQSGVPVRVAGGRAALRLPKLSMTALELTRAE